jgi:RNA polymerase sigma-70 factor (ECF subfamily)
MASMSEAPITDLTVAAARSGDHSSIGALGSAAFRRTVAFYRYTGLSTDVAEDLAADAVEAIIAKLPTLREVDRYEAWMWSIARNRLRDHWRRNRIRNVREPASPAPMNPDEIAVLSEEHATIRLALTTLSLRDQELLWLREVMGLDHRVIADRVGSTAAATRVACHRARRRLQVAYADADTGTSGTIATTHMSEQQ